MEDEADRLLEKLQPIKKLQDNLRRNISQIKELINQARKQANSVCYFHIHYVIVVNQWGKIILLRNYYSFETVFFLCTCGAWVPTNQRGHNINVCNKKLFFFYISLIYDHVFYKLNLEVRRATSYIHVFCKESNDTLSFKEIPIKMENHPQIHFFILTLIFFFLLKVFQIVNKKSLKGKKNKKN